MKARIKRYAVYATTSLKIVCAYVVVNIFGRKLLQQKCWVIQEKGSEARDNGYHLFKYLRNMHPEVNAWFVIDKNEPDYDKVKPYGNILQFGSFSHYCMALAAKYSIGSQPFGALPDPTGWTQKFRFLCRKDQKMVFLQHGIIKEEIPTLTYDSTRFDLFTCSAKREREYVTKGLGYPDDSAQLLGLCRFDNLYDFKTKKQILIMPTFRKWLASSNRERTANDEESKQFMESNFYVGFSQLLGQLNKSTIIQNQGYEVVFYPHYSLQSYIHCFKDCESMTIKIADRFHYDVQQLLLESELLVTDFSSIFFDFAYMNKPEIFFQPDAEEYLSHHRQKGYFDFTKDAFGPVTDSVDEVVKIIECEIMNDCVVSDDYRCRADSFFSVRDRKNCERTYRAISELE